MTARRLRPEEKVSANQICWVAFMDPLTESYKEQLADPAAHSKGYEKTLGLFGEDGAMRSTMAVNDFTMRFDGYSVGMGGVEGVATLPEYRKGGAVRKLFEFSLNEMYGQGKAFSYLFPFSFAFYRKFGYECCNMANEFTLPTGLFSGYPFPERIEAFTPGGDISGYAGVYETFSGGMNLAIVRDEQSWRDLLDKDPYITRHYSYLHRDESGTPDAYLMFKPGRAEAGGEMTAVSGETMAVRELAWATRDGLLAMFGFIGGFYPQMPIVKWRAPSGFNIYTMFDEYDGLFSVRRPASGMNRIVNVRRVLSLLKTPPAGGSAAIGVFDPLIPSNTGTFRVEWDGNGPAELKPASGGPDIETDIQTLAQLAVGFINPRQAMLKKTVSIKGNLETLDALFPLKESYMMEHF